MLAISVMFLFLSVLFVILCAGYHVKVIDGASLNPLSTFKNFKESGNSASLIYGVGSTVLFLFTPLCVALLSLFFIASLSLFAILLKMAQTDADADTVRQRFAHRVEDIFSAGDTFFARINLFRTM